MWFLPSPDQWKRWSLPSKLTAIGAYVGIISIPLAVGLFGLSIYLQGRPSSSPVTQQPSTSSQTSSRPSSEGNTSAPPASQPQKPATVASAAPSTDLLKELLADLKSKELTDLQKGQIRRRFEGQRVQWSGYVRDTTSFPSGQKRVFLLLWTPASQVHDFLPDVLVATFSADQEIELTTLRKNDFVVIEGTAGFTEQAADMWAPKLTDARIVSVKPQ